MNRNLRKTILSRFKGALLAEFIGTISGAILIILLARLLDPTEYGLLFLAISILAIAKLLSTFGIAGSASRYISEYKVKDATQIRHILRTTTIFLLVSISIVIILLKLFHSIIPELLGEPDLDEFLLLGIFFVVFGTITDSGIRVIQGFEMIKLAASLSVLNKILRLIFAIVFVIIGFGALGALAGYIVGYIIVSTLVSIYGYRRFYQKYPKGPVESKLKQRILEYNFPIAITKSAYILDGYLDKILIGFFLDPLNVAFYAISKQIIQFVEMPLNALGFTLSPTFGAQKASGDIQDATKIFEQTLEYILIFYLPAVAGIIILARPGIQIVFGSDYLGGVLVLQILAIYALFLSLSKVTSQSLDYLGRAKIRSVIKSFTSILNVGLNVLLIPLIGIEGAAIATLLSFSIYSIANLYIIYKELKFGMVQVGKTLIRILLVSLLMSIIIIPLEPLVNTAVELSFVLLLGLSTWLVLSIYTGLLSIDNIKRYVTMK